MIEMAVSHYRGHLIPQQAQHCRLPLSLCCHWWVLAERGLDSIEFLTKIIFCLELVGAYALVVIGVTSLSLVAVMIIKAVLGAQPAGDRRLSPARRWIGTDSKLTVIGVR